MEIMLPCLPNLRILLLCGHHHGISKGGYLTDKSCKLIARSCPDLQELDVLFHRKLTVPNVKRIFKNCPHLRMLQTSVSFCPRDIKHLLCMAPNLLHLFTEHSFAEAFYLELVESTGGRLVPDWCGNPRHKEDEREHFGAEGHLFDLEKLSIDVQRKYRSTQSILTKQSTDCDDPKLINEWESLYGCEI